jgi:hypothetical protein
MPTLPTRDALGSVPFRANFKPHSVGNSPVGPALQQLGNAISGLAQQGMQEEQRAQIASAQTSLIQHDSDADLMLDEMKRTAPVGAVGFEESALKEYDKRAEATYAAAAPAAKDYVRNRLIATRTRLQEQARTFATTEADRVEANRIEEGLSTLRRQIDADPSRLAELEQQGRELIATARVPASVKEEAAAKWKDGAVYTAGTRLASDSGRALADGEAASPAAGAAAAAGREAPVQKYSTTINYGSADKRISEPARRMLEGIAASGVVPVVKVRSGYRDPHRNARAGGAKGSQHLHGNAVDIDVSGMSDAQKAAFLQAAVANGAKGIGIYPSGNSLHIDTRSSPAVWGAVKGNAYKGHSVDEAPSWAQPVLRQLFSGENVPAPVGGPMGKRLASDAAREFTQDPRFASLSVEQVRAMEMDFIQGYNARTAEIRQAESAARVEAMRTVGPLLENAQSEIMNTGVASNPPTREQVFSAYPPDEAAKKWTQYENLVETGGQIAAMRTMTPEEQLALVKSQEPQPGSPTYAADAAQHELLKEAAVVQNKARAADPFGYTASVFPDVAETWNGAVSAEDRADAIRAMAEAQREIGIPADQMALIPAPAVSASLKSWGDVEKPYAERVKGVADLVFSAEGQGEREAIMDQLVRAGLPAGAAVALRAMERGDTAAAERLSRAILADPKDMPTKLPDDYNTDAKFNARVAELMFAPSTIGDAMFGTGIGMAGSDADVQAYYDVAKKAARFAAATAGSTDAAVAQVQKDMFGNVALYADGSDIVIAVPKAYDPELVADGLRAQLGRVDQMLATFAEPKGRPDPDKAAPNERAPMRYQNYLTDQTISEILDASQWRNAGEGEYQLIDTTTGTPIADRFGNVFTISAEEAAAAGAQTRRARDGGITAEPGMAVP